LDLLVVVRPPNMAIMVIVMPRLLEKLDDVAPDAPLISFFLGGFVHLYRADSSFTFWTLAHLVNIASPRHLLHS
jgi:hypothetical protein